MKLITYYRNFNFMDIFRITRIALPIGVYFVVKSMHWAAAKKHD